MGAKIRAVRVERILRRLERSQRAGHPGGAFVRAFLFWLAVFIVGDISGFVAPSPGPAYYVVAGELLTVAAVGIGIHFVARRRANAIRDCVYDAVRLGHPLPESLRVAGEGARGKLALRLLVAAELLRHGQTLAESLGLAAREMPRRDPAAISAAERSGRLLTTLERLKSEQALWHPSDELTWPYVGYALFAAGTLFALLLLWAVLILPEWIKLLRSYGVALPFGFLFPNAPPSDIFLQPTALNRWTLPAMITATVVSVPPILIFLRKTLTPYAHRWRWTGWLWDRALWCFPVARSLERSRSWAGRLDVTLLPHLENCHTRYSIAVVLASLASRR